MANFMSFSHGCESHGDWMGLWPSVILNYFNSFSIEQIALDNCLWSYSRFTSWENQPIHNHIGPLLDGSALTAAPLSTITLKIP